MRLPVDVHGDRVYDDRINVLTVIANESYEEYVSGLQSEFDEAGYAGKVEVRNAKEDKVKVRPLQKNLDLEEFKILWSKISRRTKCNISIDTEKLIADSIEKINSLDVRNLVVTVDKVDVFFDDKGKIQTSYKNQSTGARIEADISIPNVIERIARET